MLLWLYAYRSLLARIRANAVTMLSVSIFIAGATMGLSYYLSLRSVVVSVPDENIVVVSKSAVTEGDSKLALESARKVVLLDGVKKLDNTPVAARELVSRVFVASQTVGQYEPPSRLRGIDDRSVLIHHVKIVEGAPPKPNSLELLIGRRVAQHYPHVKIGYEFPMPGGPSRVAGIFTADGGAFEDEIWTPRAALEIHLNQKRTSSVTLVAENAGRVGEIIDKINGSKELDARAESVAEFRANLLGLASVARTVLLLLVMLSVVAIFTIATTMSSAVATRVPELAALVAIGVRRRSLGWTIFLESALLGLVGAIVGVIASAIVISQLGYIPIGSNPIDIVNSPIALTIGLALGLLAGIVGGSAPAFRVRRLNVLTALR
jgi:putative ABC transport system permease protein